MLVSPQIIAALGGSQEHSITRKPKARAWLDSRIRKALVPLDNWGERFHGDSVEDNANMYARRVLNRLKGIPLAKSGVPPVDRTPQSLAAFLEIEPLPEDTLEQVFLRYLQKRVREANEICYQDGIRRALKQSTPKLEKELDAWIPILSERDRLVEAIEKVLKIETDIGLLKQVFGRDVKQYQEYLDELAVAQEGLREILDEDYPGKTVVYRNKLLTREPRSRFVTFKEVHVVGPAPSVDSL